MFGLGMVSSFYPIVRAANRLIRLVPSSDAEGRRIGLHITGGMYMLVSWGTKRSKIGFTLLLVLVLLIASACSKGGNGGSEGTGTSKAPQTSEGAVKQEIVELKAFFPGDTPQDFDKVLTAVNDKLAADGVGAKLNITFTPWDDYGNMTTLKTTAGEEFDMFLDAPWLHIQDMISKDAIIPLDEYVGVNEVLKQSIPEQMWEQNKFNGKIYGIPLGTVQGNWKGFTIRKDLREKYNLPVIKSIADLEAFLRAVKKNDSGITPFGIDGRYALDLPLLFDSATYENGQTFFPVASGTALDARDGKIYAIHDFPNVQPMFERVHRYYTEGLFDKNILQEQNAVQLFNNGMFAVTLYGADGVEGMKYLDVIKNVPGAELEYVMLNVDGVKPVSDFKQWNFLVVPKSSKHPELVMKVMDWLSIPENHDLLELGIEGTHWKAVGEDQYEVVEGTGYSFPGYVISWRPTIVRTPVAMLPQDKELFELGRLAETFSMSPIAGFNADLEPIKTEVAQFNTINDSILNPLSAGLFNPAEYLSKLKDEASKAGMDKIVKEIQAQYDAYKSQ